MAKATSRVTTQALPRIPLPAPPSSSAGMLPSGRDPGLVDPFFYVWASVIENGRVAATDYAPDVGWLDPSATAKP